MGEGRDQRGKKKSGWSKKGKKVERKGRGIVRRRRESQTGRQESVRKKKYRSQEESATASRKKHLALEGKRDRAGYSVSRQPTKKDTLKRGKRRAEVPNKK